jgi:uncharacterized membrane protein
MPAVAEMRKLAPAMGGVAPQDAAPREDVMTEWLPLALRFAAALGSGVMAGLFFAFSVAVMGGLARIDPGAGMAAMQSINRVILNPLFALAFFGTPVVCAALIVSLLWRWHEPGAVLLLAGSLLYIAGVFVVTMVCNVPLNNALEAVVPGGAGAAERWNAYLSSWTAWNHVRTVSGCLAAALLMAGIYMQARGAPPGA